MKKWLIVATLVTSMILSPSAAQADEDKVWAALGGVLGGIVLSNIAHDKKEQRQYKHHHKHYSEAHYSSHRRGHSKVHRKGGDKVVIIHKSPSHRVVEPTGHYEYRSVKKWVPGSWVVHYDDCGSRYKRWQRGYYKIVRKKVWVENEPACEIEDRHYSRRH